MSQQHTTVYSPITYLELFSLFVSGGVLHGSGPDVHDDPSVLCVRGAGGRVRVPRAV